MEPAQMGDSSVETTCASVRMMIPTVTGTTAKTTENVTANASQTGNLVTRPVCPDTTSAITPPLSRFKMASPSSITEMFVVQQATFQNTTNTAAPVTSACPPDRSVPLTRAAPVQQRPRVRRPSSWPSPPPPPPLCLCWSHQAQGGGDFSSSFSLFKMY